MIIWDYTEGFSATENWGESDGMNGFLLILMTILRGEFRLIDPDAVFEIHCGCETDGHAPNSQHPKGNAADFHINTLLSYDQQIDKIRELLQKLQVSIRVGFGIYPQWNNPGFHIDVRGELARWGFLIVDGKNKMVSFAEAQEFVRKNFSPDYS